MKKYNTIWLLLLSLCSIIVSCKKDKTIQEQLPPETHIGAYTFGCKVDGKIYAASGKEGLLSSEYIEYYFQSDTSIHISVRSRRTNKDFDFDFTIHNTGSVGTYLLKEYPYPNDGNFNEFGNDLYETTLTHTGTMNIKYFDGSFSQPYEKGTVLAGTFQMDAISGAGKVIHITEGRFDIGQ